MLEFTKENKKEIKKIELKLNKGVIEMMNDLKEEKAFNSNEELISSLIRDSHTNWRKENIKLTVI